MATSMTPEATQKAMLEGLRSHLRAALRDQFEQAAKPIIEDAIKSALETFEVSLQQFLEAQSMRHLVEVVLTDRRTKTD